MRCTPIREGLFLCLSYFLELDALLGALEAERATALAAA